MNEKVSPDFYRKVIESVKLETNIRKAFVDGFDTVVVPELHIEMPTTDMCNDFTGNQIPKTIDGLVMLRNHMPFIYAVLLEKALDDASVTYKPCKILPYAFMAGGCYGYRVSMLLNNKNEKFNEMETVMKLAQLTYDRICSADDESLDITPFKELINVPQELVPEGNDRIDKIEGFVEIYKMMHLPQHYQN